MTFEQWYEDYWQEASARRAYDALVRNAAAAKPQAPTTISVWQFRDAPAALRDLATPLAAPPTDDSIAVYVPAIISVNAALRLLKIPDEESGPTQVTKLPDGGTLILSERR